MWRWLEMSLAAWILLCSRSVLAGDSSEPAVMPPGDVRVVAAAGLLDLNRDLTYGIEISFEVGLVPGLELGGPLALGVRLIDGKEAGELYVVAGVVDFVITPKGNLLYSPAVALAGLARFGPESALRAAIDFSGAEEGFGNGDHPVWMRGAASLTVDVGPWISATMGFAYQRILADGETPGGVAETGWVGDSRVSIGSVRSHPLFDVPFLSAHVAKWFDIVLLARFDINTDTDTTDSRWLLGVKFVSDRTQ